MPSGGATNYYPTAKATSQSDDEEMKPGCSQISCHLLKTKKDSLAKRRSDISSPENALYPQMTR